MVEIVDKPHTGGTNASANQQQVPKNVTVIRNSKSHQVFIFCQQQSGFFEDYLKQSGFLVDICDFNTFHRENRLLLV